MMTKNRRKKKMKRAINYLKAIKEYEIEKYDDYDRRNGLSMRERMANEEARNVLEKLLKHLESLNDEVKENEDVRTDGDGEVPAETVLDSRAGSEEEVSEVHAGLSKA